MVDVTHDGNHRRARLHFNTRFRPLRPALFRIVLLGGDGLMAHFFDQNNGGFLVEHLVDGAIMPSFIRCLMTSEALTDILSASSATVMVSGTSHP